MKIKCLFLILSIFFLSSPETYAQKEKVVEASDKKKPEWIGRSGPAFFSVTESGRTMTEASGSCLATVRQYIMNSIAVNVTSTEVMVSRQVTKDNMMSAMNDYSSVLMTEACRLPYLNDISLSNAESVYWEKIYDRTTKSYRYEYSVRYPFDAQTRQSLIDWFLEVDNEKSAALERLENEIGTFVSLDCIPRAINELKGLEAYFFDSVRRTEANVARNNWQGLHKRISILVESENLGECIYSLRVDGRPVTTSVQPRLKSESAIEMSVVPLEGNRYKLSYNPSYASPYDLNAIEIAYPFGVSVISKTIMFNP